MMRGDDADPNGTSTVATPVNRRGRIVGSTSAAAVQRNAMTSTGISFGRAALRRAGPLLAVAPLALVLACSESAEPGTRVVPKSPESEAYENAKEPMTDPTPSPTTANALQYGFKGHRFEMIPPDGFEFSQTAPPFGRVYRFEGAQGPEGPAPIFTIVIRVPLPSAANPTARVVMDSMLADYAKRLAEYERCSLPPLAKKGIRFERAAFTGHLGRHLMRGVVFVGARNQTYYVMFAFAEHSRFGVIEKSLKRAIDSFSLI